MGLLDILRGQRASKRPALDALFAIPTVELTMRANLGFEPIPRAAVCFKPVQAGTFQAAMGELDDLLALSGRSSGTAVDQVDDAHGYRWITLADEDIGELVVTVHAVSEVLRDRGYADQLLAAVFGFRRDDVVAWLIYAFRRAAFYPFVPAGDRTRDSALELRLKATLERELPLEQEIERWYPLWDLPIAG